MRISILIWAIFLSAVCTAPAFARLIRGRVVEVIDGETLTLDNQGRLRTVRLYGIDAPEPGQPFADAAAEGLRELVLRRVVEVKVTRFTRQEVVGVVYLGKRNINELMLSRGLAWRYFPGSTSQVFSRAQNEAQRARRGLWSEEADPVPPWEWRRRLRDADFDVDASPEARAKAARLVRQLEPELEMVVLPDRSKLMQAARPIYRVSVSNAPDVTAVQLSPTEVEIIGVRPGGQSDVTLWFDTPAQETLRYQVKVAPRARARRRP